MHGTNLSTLATAGASRVIDNCEVVNYVDSIMGTILLALHAADTAVCAILSCFCALCVVRALNDYARGVGDKMNNRVRAGACAKTAADALSRVDVCNAVNDGDRALGADLHAVTVAKAGIGAELVARVSEVCNAAGVVTLKIVSCLNYITGTVTGNVCDLLDDILGLKAEDSRDIVRCGVTAGNAERGVCAFARCESACVGITTVVATSTAVSAGEAVANLCLALVNGNAEEMI